MRASEIYESAVEELKDRLPKLKSHTYDTIDTLMQDISFRHRITGKRLHDMFVTKYGHTPDTWIKKYKNKLGEEDVTEMDKSQTPPGRDGSNDPDAGKKEYTAKLITPKKAAKDGEKTLNKVFNKKKGVAEGLDESYIIIRTNKEGKQDVFAKFDTYEKAQKELDACLAHPLHTKYKQKFELKRKGQQGQQGVAEEKQRLDPKCWTGYKKQGTKMKGGVRVNNCVPAESVEEGENWSKHNNPRAGGMSQKSVNSYRRSHPGSKIQTAVTTKPSKLKKGSKSAKRRASFCARMRGMKKHRTGAKTARDPNSNINKSLRRWHCESIEEMQNLMMIAEQKVAEAKNLKQQAAIAIAKKKSVTEMDKSQTPPGRDGSNDSDAGKKEYTAKTTTAKKVAKDGEKTLNKIFKDTPKKKVSESVDNADQLQQIKDFINWSMKTLNMQKPYPKFTLSRNTQQAQQGHHTGLHNGDRIWVYIENRNLVDIFRTIFHELVHHRQDQLNMIKDGDSYPGSPIEALADMMAGKYIKIYGKDHSEIFQ